MVDLDETTILLAAFVILLVPFPLISYGTTEGIQSLWWLGLALLVLGGLVPPVSRYVFEDEEEGKEDGESDAAADEPSDGPDEGGDADESGAESRTGRDDGGSGGDTDDGAEPDHGDSGDDREEG